MVGLRSIMRVHYDVHSRLEAWAPGKIMLYKDCRLGQSRVGYGMGA